MHILTAQYCQKLDAAGIPHEAKADTHLVAESRNGHVDVWPTTGKWTCRVTKRSGFGLLNLIDYCIQKHCDE